MKLFFHLLIFMSYTVLAEENLAQEKKERLAIKSLISVTERLSSQERACYDDRDCIQFPTGSRACGGPNGYVLTSRHNPLLDEVEYLARQSEIRESAFNQKYGIYSICSVVPKPIAKCVAKVCR